MRVSVKLMGAFKQLVPQAPASRLLLELDDPATLRDLIDKLGEAWGEQFKARALCEGPDGKVRLRPFVRVIIDGKTLDYSPVDQLSLPRKEGETMVEVFILQAIQGGLSYARRCLDPLCL
ncbi:MAG: MoaD/ThiS family protein [Candidatus Tectomicrobia bacterium]|uniref:MoaD/ThiS family protein n=1 Tax=Tectimicrobiota bacterium TaxID=2528274 RepID=A0A932FW37_UNCTE|nr:MoaD/ThiS family protein [Candidatus Tectomicrobia bacterium]